MSKGLDYQVNKILDDYQDIKLYVRKKPELLERLKKTYKTAYEKNKWAMKGADFIDSVDQFLGPAEAVTRWFGPGLGYLISGGLRLAEWAVKLPYSIYYGTKTGDWGSVGIWAANEAAAFLLPFGDLIDVVPVYKWRANKYLRGTVADAFKKQYMGAAANDNKQATKEYSDLAKAANDYYIPHTKKGRRIINLGPLEEMAKAA